MEYPMIEIVTTDGRIRWINVFQISEIYPFKDFADIYMVNGHKFRVSIDDVRKIVLNAKKEIT